MLLDDSFLFGFEFDCHNSSSSAIFRIAGQRVRVRPREPAVRLAAFEVRLDPIQIVPVLRRIGVTRCIKFSKYFVFPGLLFKRALRGYRWSFSCSHDSPESFSSPARLRTRTRPGGSRAD